MQHDRTVRSCDIGPWSHSGRSSIDPASADLAKRFDGSFERCRVEGLAQHLRRADAKERDSDFIIVEPSDEDRGQVPPPGNEATLHLAAVNVGKSDVEDETASRHIDVAS